MYIPSATYRLQFNSSFKFDSAKEIVDYLNDLGISTIYASPIFKARKGSTHGYDVTDPNAISPEIGSTEEFNSLIESIHSHEMGWLQDFVPNHMAYDCNNHMLMDIFEKGPSSPYFEVYDIVWSHLRENLRGKLIAPFLGGPYGEALEKGELSIGYDVRGFFAKYYDTEYPLRIESYSTILNQNLDSLREQLGENDPSFIKILGITNILVNLPDYRNAAARNAQIRLGKELLLEIFQTNPRINIFIKERIQQINSDIDLLDRLLLQQWFRLSYWRVATKEINYQRFFNVNELISLRMEVEHVFRNTHKLVLGLLADGKVNGLRIDHIDGLYDPTDYLNKLRQEASDAYIVVEKILGFSEQLPENWPVQDTTGYEFLNRVNGVFIDSKNEAAFQSLYDDFTGLSLSYKDLLSEKKRLIIERHLTGDLDNLTYELKKISITTREGIDLAWIGLKRSLTAVAVAFPVYRTYIDSKSISARDWNLIDEAVETARSQAPELDREITFLKKVLLLQYPENLSDADRSLWLSFVMRFQQFTGPLMAKGLEDTTFYIYNRLLSLNEVGGSPDKFGVTPDSFHDWIKQRQERFPNAMNTTATHDMKRGEDVRARLNVLSEIPDEWKAKIDHWSELNHVHRKSVNNEEIPTRNQEYLLYQTLLSSLPYGEFDLNNYRGRIREYIIKAARESKTHTFWLENNVEFEKAILQFIDDILADSNTAFLNSLRDFQRRIGFYAVFNSLSQALLKITSPGLPDFYQGSELWDLSLVDPDNRRPVDYQRRQQMLREIKEGASLPIPLIKRLVEKYEDGAIKMFTIYRALGARRQNRELFDSGQYMPLPVTGALADHVIAFTRRSGSKCALVAAPRLLTNVIEPGQLPLGKSVWGHTTIDVPAGFPSHCTNVFTGGRIDTSVSIPLASLFEDFPLGFLIN